MRNTSSKERLFNELVKVAIGDTVCLSHTPSADEWGDLYSFAKKQSLVGVCFAGVQRLVEQRQEPSEMLYLTWMGMAAKVQQKNEVVNRQCVELQAKLSADGFRSCVLKGQGVAKVYPEHLRGLRQSGDIDVWIDSTAEKAIAHFAKDFPDCKPDNKHLHFNCFSDTEVEVHWIPVKRNNPIWSRILGVYFDSERERQFINIVDGLCVPTADFQLVHQLLHVYGHYVYEGVGMRQMMDLYFAQLACAKGSSFDSAQESTLEKVRGLFKRLGLMRFVGATQWVLGEVFQMHREQMLCEPDADEGQKLLDEIMIGGNFGHHDERNHVEGESFFGRFFRRWGRKFRMFRFDPLGTLLMPFSRIKLEIWMRKVRRLYNV